MKPYQIRFIITTFLKIIIYYIDAFLSWFLYIHSILLIRSSQLLRQKIASFGTRAMSTANTSYLIDDPKYSFLKHLDLNRANNGVYNGKWFGSGPPVKSIDPATGQVIAEVSTGTAQDFDECVEQAVHAYNVWSNVPAPQRGEIIRQIGEELRKNLEPLGKLVSLGSSPLKRPKYLIEEKKLKFSSLYF